MSKYKKYSPEWTQEFRDKARASFKTHDWGKYPVTGKDTCKVCGITADDALIHPCVEHGGAVTHEI